MKPETSGARDRAKAKDWLLMNLLVLPGMGSVLAGRRVAGYAQVLLALSGMLLSLIFAVALVRDWWERGEVVLPSGHALLVGCAGVLLFALGWCWGLTTGLRMLREAGLVEGGRSGAIRCRPHG